MARINAFFEKAGNNFDFDDEAEKMWSFLIPHIVMIFEVEHDVAIEFPFCQDDQVRVDSEMELHSVSLRH